MKKAFIVLLVVVGLLFTAGNAFGTEGNVYAKILDTEVALTENGKLGFGAILPGTTSGTITLTPDADESGKVTVTTVSLDVGKAGAGNSGTIGGAFTPLLSAGKFTATGLNSVSETQYDIYLPSVVALSNGVNTIYASDFKAYTTESNVFAERVSFSTLAGEASRVILIGATLTVPGSQAAGNYSGTYTIFLYEHK